MSSPDRQPRADNNRFAQKYSDEEFLDAIRELDVPATKAIWERVGCSQSLADRRLKELEEADVVEKVDMGNMNVWKLVD
ncbi:winged helix-turn-helix domain-containing protein [Halostella sp. JP-L12]|uniref:winged helix-turn-helix domain-containing protein n=1 Tax=Halostella TaxID=1843185 RepID=UPI000EF75BB4|nr:MULTISPECIES: winged helix-turn-helix domain-containing protein [Halostella]NHN49992.1 winged helix-turn-helix domain-containing protein [Halostella sp. JP-L12]